MYDRYTLNQIKERLEIVPIVIIEGSRQTGKSTLVKTYMKEYNNHAYFSLDDKDRRDIAKEDPKFFTEREEELIIIDEIQKVPDLVSQIKLKVDENRFEGNTKQKFILTGSSDIFHSHNQSESLAGRAIYTRLDPLSQTEILGCSNNFVDILFNNKPLSRGEYPLSRMSLLKKIVTGGYPEAQSIQRNHKLWFNNYIKTVLEKDVREISRIGSNIHVFKQLFQLLCTRASQELVLSNISKEEHINIDRKTVDNYIDILKKMFLVYTLRGWKPERSQRAISSPKIYINDTGIICAQNNFTASSLENHRKQYGFIFENFVVNEIRKMVNWSDRDIDMFHYRTKDGTEVDLVLEDQEGRIILIEIKSSSNPNKNSYSGIEAVKRKFPSETFHKSLIIDASEQLHLTQHGNYRVPISCLWNYSG